MLEQQPNIYQRILAIMGEISYIQKGDKMVNGQYRYASHDQVTAAIHPLLVKHRVVVVPTIEEILQEGNRTVVKLTTVFVNVDSPKDCFHVKSAGFGIDSGDKGPGKAVSYAFKLAILKTFCLETGEDPDQDAKSVYKADKCPEFDLALPEGVDKAKLKAFLAYSSTIMQKDVEDVKRAALNKMPAFLEGLKNWKPSKGDKE